VFINQTNHLIVNGDSRDMWRVGNNSVHLIITSPPYWQLKDYGDEKQIGFHQSYEEYINNLNLVWKECHRALHDGCRMCVNIGDQFARSVYYGRYKVIPIRTEIIKFCEALGMDYMGAVIWQKNTTMNTSGGGSVMGSFPFPRNGILKIDYEFILIFKKLGNPPVVSAEAKNASIMTKEEWNTYFSSHWTFGGARQDQHLAVFPEELPSRLIKMFSFVGETVLDPFIGSGTTSLAAKKLGRNSIGYEINAGYIDVCKEKIGCEQIDFSGASYTFETDARQRQYDVQSGTLPYIFYDPHKMDKKIDPRKMKFGSKINDHGDTRREDYYTVKRILNPELIILNNDLTVRLIGVKENPVVNGSAIEFLKEKLMGQRVYLKYDNVKYDDDNNLLCYLYLKNRTFINARLIKTGLARVDRGLDYRYKKRFIEMEKSYE